MNQKLTEEAYYEKAKSIWEHHVPEVGQSSCVRGEMLRAVCCLRDEAQHNRNINFNKNCHVIMIEFLRTHLCKDSVFEKQTIEQVNSYLDRLLDDDRPYTNDDLYFYLIKRVVDWTTQHKKLTPNPHNPKLFC